MTKPVRQSEQLYEAHQQRIYRQTDRMFAVLMVLQWIGGIIAALVISPRTWIGQTSEVHTHVWAAVLLGGVISLLPILMAVFRPGDALTRHTIAVGQMLMSSLLIHLSGGRIETHFHVFGSLAFLSFYRDWRVLIPATVVVALDHMVRGIFYPQSVFGVMTPDNWRWVEHAAWVLFEDTFLVLSCLRGQHEMHQIAENTARLDMSEARYRSVTDSASEAIVTMDEAGTIQFVNRSAEMMFGYEGAELVGRSIFTLVPEADHRRHKLRMKRYLSRLQDAPSQVAEIAVKHQDGQELLTETSFAVYRVDGGRSVTAVVRDITERKRAEEALKRSQEYENLFKLANDAIIIYEPETENILNVNDYACRMYGYSRDEFIGLSLEDISETDENLNGLLSNQWTGSIECVQRKKDGTAVHILIKGSAIEFEGKPAILTINRDVTQRNEMDRALQSNVSLLKSTFEATVDGIVAVDLENNIVTANERFLEMWDIPAELAKDVRRSSAKISDRMLTALHDPEDLIELMARSIENPDEILVSRLELADGRVYERYTRPQKLRGETIGRVMCFRDITEQVRAQETLRDSEERYRHLFDRNPYPIWVYDRETLKFLAVNEAALKKYGYTRGEFLEMTIKDIRPAEDVPKLLEFMARSRERNEVVTNVRHQKKDGRIIDVQVAAQTIFYAGRSARIGLVTDLTDRNRADAALRLSETRLRTLLESMSEGLLQVDADDNITYINHSICEMTGYSQDELIGTRWSRLLAHDGDEFVKGINERRRKGVSDRYETRIRKRNGDIIWVIVGGAPITDEKGAVVGSMGVFTDITDRKRAEEQLLYDALHDGLTGLANRTLFMDHLRMTIERGKSKNSNPFAVLYLDLDRFKVINDSLGHAEGDKLLRYLARRLEKCTRTGDLVARLGGDEFVILLSELEDPGEALVIAERIQESLKESFDLGGRKIFTTTSIGVTLSTSGHTNADDMVRDADIAMYCAKSKGKAQHQVFDQDMHKHASRKLQIETEMRTALERDEFRLFYQPIVSLATQELMGFEALLRWEHPERGIITPDEFIPIAEENGMIVTLGQWTVEESCRQMREWQRRDPRARGLTVSVNLSCKEFLQLDLADRVAATLKRTRLAPSSLKLEITETHIMENQELAVTIIERLRALGVEMSLDDFGTGYSSLSYLHRLPVTFLKIDRSFVSRMARSEENREIVHTIVKLGRNLKKRVIAEGIETTDQLADLAAMDCEFGQGYFFSQPLDAASARKYISASSPAASIPPPTVIERLELNM